MLLTWHPLFCFRYLHKGQPAILLRTMSFSNVGSVWTPSSFEKYLAGIPRPAWAKAVCLHHTAEPSLQQRPKGLVAQHIHNMQDFYQRKGWRSGPHLFADDDQLWGMSPLTEPGVHAVSFNKTSIGIEVLGDYDSESPTSGRGLECWKIGTQATKILLDWLQLPANNKTVLFHRDDPLTSKTCPGKLITKNWILAMIAGTAQLPKAEAPLILIPDTQQYKVVSEYLKDLKGYNDSDIANLLRKDEDGLFFFDKEWLEGARYDTALKATTAPIQELRSIPKKK